MEGELAIVPSGMCITSPPTEELFLENIRLLLELVDDCMPSAATKLPPDAAIAAAVVDEEDDFFSE